MTANPKLRSVLKIFHVIEIIAFLALGAAAGYVLYKDTANTVGYIVAAVAVLFLIVGVVGLGSRKLFVPLALFHLVVQGVFIVLVGAFLSKFTKSINKLDGADEAAVQQGVGYLDSFQFWICIGVGAHMVLELVTLMFTVYTLRKDEELVARRLAAGRVVATPVNV